MADASNNKMPTSAVSWACEVGGGNNADPELPCPTNPELRTLYNQYLESRTRYFYFRERLSNELARQRRAVVTSMPQPQAPGFGQPTQLFQHVSIPHTPISMTPAASHNTNRPQPANYAIQQPGGQQIMVQQTEQPFASHNPYNPMDQSGHYAYQQPSSYGQAIFMQPLTSNSLPTRTACFCCGSTQHMISQSDYQLLENFEDAHIRSLLTESGVKFNAQLGIKKLTKLLRDVLLNPVQCGRVVKMFAGFAQIARQKN